MKKAIINIIIAIALVLVTRAITISSIKVKGSTDYGALLKIGYYDYYFVNEGVM